MLAPLQTRSVRLPLVVGSIALIVCSVCAFVAWPKPVVTLGISSTLVPAEWRDPPVSFSFTASTEYEWAREAVEACLSQYSSNFVRRNLSQVHVVASLRAYGLRCGGTFIERHIVLCTNGDDGRRLGRADLQRAFHHELCNSLQQYYVDTAFETEWRRLNLPGFQYQGSPWLAATHGRSHMEWTPRWIEVGFVCEYSTATVREDISCTIEGFFLDDSSFWEEVCKSAILQAKMHMAIRLYERIDADTGRMMSNRLKSKLEGSK